MKRFYLIPMMILLFVTFNYAQNANVGDDAPDFSLQKLSGGTFKLSDYEGKVVFIFFFGYGCPHCLANGPNTQSGIYDVYRGNSDFVAVGVDTWDGNAAGVENFKSSTGIQYQLCLKGGVLEETYQTTYDRIVIVDKYGVIRFKATSDATNSVVSEAASVIDIYLQEEYMPMEEPPMKEPPMEEPPMEGEVTALNELSINHRDVKFFPNPVKGILHIETKGLTSGMYEFDLFDVKGRPVFKAHLEKKDDENLSIPLFNISDGMYIVKLSSSKSTIVSKLFFQK